MMGKSLTSLPLVSIGVPVYNGEQFLRQTLDSLLGQTYENLELIISDNASTDMTGVICQEYAARDHRVQYYRNNVNLGGVANMNRVFELSSGDFFMWASDEDYWAPDYVRSCMEVLVNSEKIILVGTWGKFVDAETEEGIKIDRGFSTVGLSPSERFKLHKLAIHSGSYVACIFHGIYKRGPLRDVMPVWNLVLTDQLLLARLCFLGESHVVPRLLMMKRRNTKARTDYEGWCHEGGISNSLLIDAPYMVRDILYQKIIFQTDKLTLKEKIRLSYWSLISYDKIRPYVISRLRRIFRRPYYALRHLAKLSIVRSWELVKSSTRKTRGR